MSRRRFAGSCRALRNRSRSRKLPSLPHLPRPSHLPRRTRRTLRQLLRLLLRTLLRVRQFILRPHPLIRELLSRRPSLPRLRHLLPLRTCLLQQRHRHQRRLSLLLRRLCLPRHRNPQCLLRLRRLPRHPRKDLLRHRPQLHGRRLGSPFVRSKAARASRVHSSLVHLRMRVLLALLLVRVLPHGPRCPWVAIVVRFPAPFPAATVQAVRALVSPCGRKVRGEGRSLRAPVVPVLLVERPAVRGERVPEQCRQARVPARARPAVRKCFRLFQTKCRRRRSLASLSMPANLRSASGPQPTSASWKASASCTRRGSVPVPVAVVLPR